MSNVSVLFGASVIGFLLLLLFMKLGDSKKDENGKEKNTHVLLQVLILGFILATFVIIGKASFDDGDKSCAWLVNQSISSGNSSTYSYEYNCVSTDTTTSFTFYQLTVWIMRIIGIYMFCYLAYVVLVYFGYVGDKKGRDD